MNNTDTTDDFDICANKHGGVETSQLAYENSQFCHSDQRNEVYDLIFESDGGLTMKEVACAMDTRLNCVSGRASELLQMNWIKDSGLRRAGCRVLVVNG